jgi:putative ABC transport system substrate-binding protein
MTAWIRRREFITLLGGAAAAWPLAARAQQPEQVRKLGMLMPYHEHDADIRARVAVFRQELRKLGWTEGSNLRIDERWSADDMGRIRDYAAELVNLNPDVILVTGRRAVPLVQQQTRSIPVVFVGISDPVASGLVASLARPGGNLTGFSQIEFSLIEKLVEGLRELAPGIARLALISNPDNPATIFYARSFEAAATSLAIRPVIFPVHEPAEIERAIETFAREANGGVVFPPDLTILIHRKLVVSLAAKYRLPAVYTNRAYVADGGLMSYGVEVLDLYRRAASYVDRILRGEKPSELPVQQPTKYELVINLKTAKALGLDVPPMLLARADEVIE